MAEPDWNNRTLFVADNVRILRGMNSESVDQLYSENLPEEVGDSVSGLH